MTPKELGFRAGIEKAAGHWAGTLPDPAVARSRKLIAGAGLVGTATGAVSTLALMKLLEKRKAKAGSKKTVANPA